VGKRSRKRGGGDVAASPTTRAERDAARRRRAEALARREAAGRSTARKRPGKTSFEDRPPAPWGSFPLVEIVVLIGLVLLVAGFIVQGARGATMIVGGLVLASLAGLELTIREHFAGFRSHTTLLAGAVGGVAIALTWWLAGDRVATLAVAAAVFAVAWWGFRQIFVRRSGGVAFRR
jgi:hypothetical protein